jgi:hypothetical protein
VEAGRWLTALRTPPPTLASKLGVGPDVPVWTWGDLADPELAEALASAHPAAPHEAAIGIARAGSEASLTEVLTLFRDGSAPLWVVHGKGKGTVFGDTAVRATMRGGGWIDTKACAVSQDLSATRYSRRKV